LDAPGANAIISSKKGINWIANFWFTGNSP
jgi:hypothetical protein